MFTKDQIYYHSIPDLNLMDLSHLWSPCIGGVGIILEAIGCFFRIHIINGIISFISFSSSILLFVFSSKEFLFTNIPSFWDWIFVLKTRFELLKWILWKVKYFQFCVALAILEAASNAWPFGYKCSTFQIYYLVSFLCPLNMMTRKPVWMYWDFVVISQGFPWQEGLFNLHINVLM